MELTIGDLVIETHIGLERQGPGSPEIVHKALSFMDNFNDISSALDLACGTGGQTMVLAKYLSGNITGMDICPAFIDALNDKAKKMNLDKRVKGIVGSMDALSFKKKEFDLIWSEGAIDTVGFEKCLNYWNGFLKENGYIAVTCPSWIANEHPEEVNKFWTDAGSGLDTNSSNILTMQKAGYGIAAVFTLPEECWINNYFIPREAADKAILEKYAGNKLASDYVKDNIFEAELYSKYKQFYGYVFYIGKKL